MVVKRNEFDNDVRDTNEGDSILLFRGSSLYKRGSGIFCPYISAPNDGGDIRFYDTRSGEMLKILSKQSPDINF